MPYVHIRVTDEEVTNQQKAQLIKQSTAMLQEVLNKDPNTTFVIIEEVALENWGVAGLPAPEYRARQSQQENN